MTPGHDAWTAFAPAELAARLAGTLRPWCVVGGWAIDLWLGRVTRAHGDLEFTVLRADFPLFRAAFDDLDAFSAHDGTLTPLPRGETLPARARQCWLFDRAAGRWRVDLMVEDGTDGLWVCKRDPAITAPRAEMVLRTVDGIPYLSPVAILLYKAKHTRPKDEADFAAALPRLGEDDRDRLARWLGRLHPGHHWIAALAAPPSAD